MYRLLILLLLVVVVVIALILLFNMHIFMLQSDRDFIFEIFEENKQW